MTNRSNRSRGVGNTKQPPPAKHWCFTLNNWNNDEIDPIDPSICKYVFGEEIGEEGTAHIQGYIELKKKGRLSEVKKIFPRAHFEKCRNIKASIEYCKKDGTYRTNIREITTHRPNGFWCDTIEGLIGTIPDFRKIYWFWSEEGNIGKSSFAKYMYVKYGVKVITSTKSMDIVTLIDEDDEMILFDWPRCSQVREYCPFNALEQIKNGFITDGKLKKKARVTCMNSPHVVIMANEPPSEHKLSRDRWVIYNID